MVWKVALVLVVGYLGFCFVNRQLAFSYLDRYLRLKGLTAQDTYVVPEPLGPHRWSGLLRFDHTYDVVLIYSLSGRTTHVQTIHSMVEDSRVRKVRLTPRAMQVERFFKAPVWQAEGNTVVVRDLRFSYQALQNEWDPFRFRFKLVGDRVELAEWTPQEFSDEIRTLFRNVGAVIGLSRESIP